MKKRYSHLYKMECIINSALICLIMMNCFSREMSSEIGKKNSNGNYLLVQARNIRQLVRNIFLQKYLLVT